MARKDPLSRDEVLDMIARRLKRAEMKDGDFFKIAGMYVEMFCRQRKGVTFKKPEDDRDDEDVDALVRAMEKQSEPGHPQRPEETRPHQGS